MTVEDVTDALGGGPMTVSEIARALGRERSGIYRHLYALEAAGIVAREPVGQRARWILTGQELPEDWGPRVKVRRPTCREQVIELLGRRPRTGPDMARYLGRYPGSVTKVLRRLEREGIVRRAGEIPARLLHSPGTPMPGGRPAVLWELVA